MQNIYSRFLSVDEGVFLGDEEDLFIATVSLARQLMLCKGYTAQSAWAEADSFYTILQRRWQDFSQEGYDGSS